MARNNGDFSLGLNSHVAFAAAGADQYRQQMGMAHPGRLDNVVVNIPQAQSIAKAYLAAPSREDSAIPHYKALVEETKRQYDFMTRPTHKGGLGMDFEVTKEDPYSKTSLRTGRQIPDPRAMMRDVQENRRIKVLSTATTGSHPYLTDDENDMFRGVHDFFGHAASGRGFDKHGEEAAYRSHRSMFSPMARGALTTETRAQNSANNYGGLAQGEYAEQKLVIVPKAALILPPNSRSAHFAQAREEASRSHGNQFGQRN